MAEYISPVELDINAKKILKQISQMELTPKDRLAIKQQLMPQQRPLVRITNMEEVDLGYSKAQLKVEASRCLQCANAPCVKGCPVSLKIPNFIKAALEDDFEKALSIINEDSLLPAICGRVCPQERQCMSSCTVGKILKDPMQSVAIGRIERYIADYVNSKKDICNHKQDVKPATGKKVAIVGGGPSGLTCASQLVKEGHEVHIYEAFHKVGGVTVYGIPEFRLPKSIVEFEVNKLVDMGVKIHTNFLVGRTKKLLELIKEEGFDAAYICSGAGLPIFMNIEGESSVGVFSANEYLTRSNLMKAYKKDLAATPIYDAQHIVVIGGGNVAMDAARTAKRMGAKEVQIIYRRTREEMPARSEEIEHAIEEGIILNTLSNPVKIIPDENGRVCEIECIRYKLGEEDASSRRRPIPIEGSNYRLKTEAVIIAIGNSSNPLIRLTTEGLECSDKGTIIIDENCESSLKNVYAGGDIVQGAATVILAMGDGKKAAEAICKQLASS